MGGWSRALESLVMSEATAFARPSSDFWRGRRVLVTGHTGFQGKLAFALVVSTWRTGWSGISLSPQTKPNLFTAAGVESLVESHVVDIRDRAATHATVLETAPEIVFHLAAQPLVLESYRTPIETFSTNIIGSLHILEALKSVRNAKVAVMITTDKVYANQEWVYPYREDDRLGGHDPYSASKAACEIGIASYRESFLRQAGVAVATARAGNVIGGGDWSSDRLIPDIVRAWETGAIVQIRRPNSVRPWQHVLEPLCGYLILAERLWQSPNLAGAYNFGPNSDEMASVRSVIGLAQQIYCDGQAALSEENSGPHEAGLLSLEIAKAKSGSGDSSAVEPQAGSYENAGMVQVVLQGMCGI